LALTIAGGGSFNAGGGSFNTGGAFEASTPEVPSLHLGIRVCLQKCPSCSWLVGVGPLASYSRKPGIILIYIKGVPGLWV